MRDPAPWQKRYSFMLLFAVLFGLVMQYLFIGHVAGISMLIAVGAFYGLFFYAVKGRFGGFDLWRGQTRAGWLLLAPVVLLAAAYALFANTTFYILNALALPLCILMQTIILSRNGKHPWYRATFLADLVQHSLIQPFAHLPAPFGIIRSWFPTIGNDSNPAWKKANKVIAGLLIASPILLIVIVLLSSADRIFASWLSHIGSWFGHISISDGTVRLGAAAVVALYTFCYLCGLLFVKTVSSKTAEPPAWDTLPAAPPQPWKLDPVTASTVLVVINFVYILFVSIQFSYLFGAANGLLPAGVAYAEYARKGFAELVVVAILNIWLLLLSLHRVQEAGRTGTYILKSLLSLLVGCTIVMLISAYSRLSLYEQAYGFTQLRLMVHGFMIFLGVMFVIAMARIWMKRINLSKAYIGLGILAYVLLNYANLDARIAMNNMSRFEQTGMIDFAYLSSLSTDAVPALVKFKERHPDLKELQLTINRIKSRSHDTSWQAWNLSEYRARH
ncbi:DUF4153 domain-containing protein [Paenibacillus aestuarii]|uniref:DUF4153 domain-containing protein n=1 Tax=Paenibacillus aestuarii TaxID=516965 RepID=A0ABW0K543_9BACL|nr:DUF4173 domain-containing protein [Paenibacillus aestuarii]